MMLAKMRDYKTTLEYPFSVGMQATKSNVAQAISSITAVSTTATVTTASAHGYSTSDSVTITGVNPDQYNGTFTITVTSTTKFTYTMLAAPLVSPALVSQYYPYPPGSVVIEGAYITIGSVNYPLRPILSRFDWEQLNSIQIQASAVPQFYFSRRDDFGIWPIPQAVYTGNLSYHYRDRNLSVADYQTGTVTVTAGSNVITQTGGTFTSAMVGRWFTINDPTVPGQGYWYRIVNYISSSSLQINQPWTNATASTTSYRIGESPELPEEGQVLLAIGTTADFYGGMQKDPTNFAFYNNMFWTGDPGNSSRQEGDGKIGGGLIGLVDRYSDRDDRRLIKRKPKLNPLQYKVFATTLS